MPDPRPFRLHRDGPLAAAVTLLVTAPTWRMGWLRDDWLLLWRALDPATAPAGAAGVFPRPAAGLLWDASVLLGGDAPWAMHLLVAAAWCALLVGLLRWHRWFGGGPAGAVVAAAALGLHGALVEPRLWAAAGNGVLAAALGVWGAWRLHAAGGLPGRLLGGALMAAAVLARADAVVLLVLTVVAGQREDRRVNPPLLALAAAGAVALAWMVAAGGDWSVRPADAGRLLRLLAVPWGPPLPAAAAAVLGGAGVVFALVWGRLLVAAAPRPAALLLAAGAVAAAGALVDWSAAGRYVLMPAVTLALALAAWWEGVGREGIPVPVRRGVRAAVVAWLAVSAAALAVGRTAGELQAISAVETGLYRAVRAELPLPGDRLTVLNPPAVGWTGSAADVENVVSAAARRPVAVRLGRGESSVVKFPAAVWRRGAWTVWTGHEPGARTGGTP